MKLALSMLVVGVVAVAGFVVRPGPGLAYDGPVAVTAPARVVAGAPVAVTVEAGRAATRSTAELIAIGPYRTAVVSADLVGGSTSLTLPAGVTSAAGTVTLVAVVGETTVSTDLQVDPGPAADPVLPLVGARSIIADGVDTAMVAAIPEDAYGNPLPDGTPVDFVVRHPDGSMQRHTGAIRDTLAWAWVTSKTTAGRSAVAVSAAAGRGPRAVLLEVPGRPLPFDLAASPEAPLDADGSSRVTVRTGRLHDRFGNVLLDGTAATFTVERDGAVVAIVESEVVDGRATAPVPAPELAGTLTVRAVVAGIPGSPLAIGFDPALGVSGVPVAASWEAGALAVDVGPILGPLRELVADGTAVTLRVDGAVLAAAVTNDGRARLLAQVPQQAAVAVVVVAGIAVDVAR